MRKESLKQIAVFSDVAIHTSQRSILLGMMGFYPSETRFGLLTMDMDYMEAGRAEQGYLEQLEQMAAVKQEFPQQVIPFMAIDPRRPNLLELAKKYTDLGFGGFNLMKKYDTLYADISYTAHEERYLSVIKILLNTPGLREKILYGSDCYMVLLDKSERAFSMNVRGYMGEKDYRQMAETNPRAFLARNLQA